MNTIEQKAKAYDEALKQATKELNTCGSLDCDAARQIFRFFPELRESEDERAIRIIQYALEHGPQEEVGDKAKAMAWLEKQKAKGNGTDGDIMQYIEEGEKRGIKEVISFPEKYGLQKKQKPISQEDFDTAKHEATFGEQKPVEWGEDIIQKAIKEVGLTQHQINWFKTNVFPPKQEWSDEDEKMTDNIVSVLSQYIDYKSVSGTGSGYATPRYAKEIDWLKSLRPQPHWKPSEEQIRCINFFLDFHRPQYNAGTAQWKEFVGLESLRNDLLKLK